MFELTLGFVMAALFVIAYLAISRLWDDEAKVLTDGSKVTLRPADSSRAIGTGESVRALFPDSANDHTEGSR